jgi:hypothetical protein
LTSLLRQLDLFKVFVVSKEADQTGLFKEVEGTEPSPSVRVPWLTIMVYYVDSCKESLLRGKGQYSLLPCTN